MIKSEIRSEDFALIVPLTHDSMKQELITLFQASDYVVQRIADDEERYHITKKGYLDQHNEEQYVILLMYIKNLIPIVPDLGYIDEQRKISKIIGEPYGAKALRFSFMFNIIRGTQLLKQIINDIILFVKESMYQNCLAVYFEDEIFSFEEFCNVYPVR